MIVLDKRKNTIDVTVSYGFRTDIKFERDGRYYHLKSVYIDKAIKIDYINKTIDLSNEKIELNSHNLSNILKEEGIDAEKFCNIVKSSLEKMIGDEIIEI